MLLGVGEGPRSKFSALKKLFEGLRFKFYYGGLGTFLNDIFLIMSLSNRHLVAYLEYSHPNDFLLNFSAVLAKIPSSSGKHFCGMWGE